MSFGRISLLMMLCAVAALGQIFNGAGGGGGTPASPVGSVQFNLAGAFGGDAAFSYNSSLHLLSTGLGSLNIDGAAQAPLTAPTVVLAGTGAGNIDNGRHWYYVSFLTANGETGNGLASSVTVTDKTVNGKVTVTNIPTGPAGTTGRVLYRTVAQSPGFGFFVGGGVLTTLNNNTTTTYVDNTADSGLGAPAPFYNSTAGVIKYNGVVASAELMGNGYSASGDVPVKTFVCDQTSSFYLSFSNPGNDAVLAGGQNGFVCGANGTTNYTGTTNNSTSFWIQSTDMTAGTIAVNQPVVRITPYYAGSDNFANKFGAPLFGVDVDFAADGGQPFVVGMYSGEDGTCFSGGFSACGGFLGVNTLAAPAETFHVTSLPGTGNQLIARPTVGLQRAVGQTGDILNLLSSDGTTVLSDFDSNGSLRLLADAASPFIIGKMTVSAVAPGAGKADLRWVAGTNMGTCKLVSNAGTSATEVTIVDNVGGGC